MKKIGVGVSLAAIVWGFSIVSWPSSGHAQVVKPFPRLTTIATLQPGSAVHTMASGVAKVLGQHLATNVQIQSFTTWQKVFPPVNDGQIEFSTTDGYDVWTGYAGIQPHFSERLRNLRLVATAQVFDTGMLARGDAGIQTVAQIKGKRVAGGYRGAPVCGKLMEAMLATARLTPNDFTVVPVPSPTEGVQAVIEGRADVAGCAATGMGAVSEAESRVGAFFLSMDISPASTQDLKKVSEAFYPYLHKEGTRPGVKRDTYVIGFDGSLIAGASVSEDTVYQVAKALWENIQALQAVHPFLATWTSRVLKNNFS
jgi:TRAP transporter TAXI family solute receptor